MDSANATRRLLGQILIEQDLLSEEELEQALSVQEENGRPLGEILIELGLVSRPTLAKALAEQWGIELDEETGFGTGLRSAIERRYQDRRSPQTDSASPAEETVAPSAPQPEESLPYWPESTSDVPLGSAPTVQSFDALAIWHEDFPARLAEQEAAIAALAAKIEEQGLELEEAKARLAEQKAAIEALGQRLEERGSRFEKDEGLIEPLGERKAKTDGLAPKGDSRKSRPVTTAPRA